MPITVIVSSFEEKPAVSYCAYINENSEFLIPDFEG